MNADPPSVEIYTHKGKQYVTEISLAFKKWNYVLSEILEVEEIPKIVEFVDHVFERQV